MLSMKLPPRVRSHEIRPTSGRVATPGCPAAEPESIEFLDASNPRVRDMVWDISVDVAELMRRRSSIDHLDLEEVGEEGALDRQLDILVDFLHNGYTSSTSTSSSQPLTPTNMPTLSVNGEDCRVALFHALSHVGCPSPLPWSSSYLPRLLALGIWTSTSSALRIGVTASSLSAACMAGPALTAIGTH